MYAYIEREDELDEVINPLPNSNKHDSNGTNARDSMGRVNDNAKLSDRHRRKQPQKQPSATRPLLSNAISVDEFTVSDSFIDILNDDGGSAGGNFDSGGSLYSHHRYRCNKHMWACNEDRSEERKEMFLSCLPFQYDYQPPSSLPNCAVCGTGTGFVTD